MHLTFRTSFEPLTASLESSLRKKQLCTDDHAMLLARLRSVEWREPPAVSLVALRTAVFPIQKYHTFTSRIRTSQTLVQPLDHNHTAFTLIYYSCLLGSRIGLFFNISSISSMMFCERLSARISSNAARFSSSWETDVAPIIAELTFSFLIVQASAS